MSELTDLYQEVILEHAKRPRNFGPLAGATGRAEGFNPLCGDHLFVEIALDGGVIRDIRFTGTGCAISRASASVMTGEVKGLTVEAALAAVGRFREISTLGSEALEKQGPVGKLAVFGGIHEFPTRVKCATLAWHAMEAALKGQQSSSTE